MDTADKSRKGPVTPTKPSGQGHRITWDEEACMALGTQHGCPPSVVSPLLREKPRSCPLRPMRLRVDCTMTGA